MMLDGLRQTKGTAVTVTEQDMLAATERLATEVGIWGSPEGGSCVAAFEQLVESGWIRSDETVVLFNTGAAAKYL